jgi:alkanesulfonate monooxygenase SsuD/methylene tetrahydromethanopterin reductase-like flavin-dependent oxidoreductase (luciferase family)
MSKAPERWPALWDEIVAVTKMADEAGMDFILPVAKWHGYAGESNNLGRSFETMTHGAALGAITRQIGIFATVHVPITTPAFAAKAIATIDHVSHGRAGLNIVCGWNSDEFDMHGVTIDAERRYDQGLEWFKIFSKLLEGGPKFDWDGEFYKLKGLTTDPVSVQRPYPPIMSAGFSRKGRDFAAQACDVLFTIISELDQIPEMVRTVKERGAAHGRKVGVYTQGQVVCRPTRQEAEDYYYYFAEEMADQESLAYYHKQVGKSRGSDTAFSERPTSNRFMRESGKKYAGAYPGVYPLIGTPDDIVAELVKLKEAGLVGIGIVFLNYLTELPYFAEEVLPRMKRAGLRT